MLYIHGLIHLEQAHDADWASTWCGNVNVTHTWYNGQEDGPLWAYGHMHNTWHWHLETTVIDNIDKYIKENKGATTSEAYTFLRRPDLLLRIHWLQQMWEWARDAATRFNTLLSATAPGPPRRPDYTQWSLALSCHTCLHTFVFLASQAASTSYDTTGTVVTQTYFLRYHGNSHRDSGETYLHTSYDTTGTVTETVVKWTKRFQLDIRPLTIPRGQWWNERNIPTWDNKVYIDDDNTWEQLRRDCVNIYWKDHIWAVDDESLHVTGNLIHYLAFHGQSQTRMRTSLNRMDHMRACKPNSNGNKLESNRSLQTCYILSETFIWFLHYTTMWDWNEINGHRRQYRMSSWTLTSSKWNYDKWMAHKRELSNGQLSCSGNTTTKNLQIHRMTWKPRRLTV